MAQVEYRLEHAAGCVLEPETGDAPDSQVAYRLAEERPLEWVGDGLREVGIEPGSVLGEAGKDAARAIMDGRDPRTGEVLVAPKLAVDPRAKLPAAPLLDAVAAAASAAGVEPAVLLAGNERAAARYARAARGVTRHGEHHRVPVGELERVAAVAGVDLAGVYPAQALATAREHAGKRVVVGNRGYDLTLDLAKSYSVLYALADPALAAELEEVYLSAVRETVTAMQGWAGYGMRGHHGDGQRAERIATSGLLGWMMVHRTARPVAGAAPDPHLHAHVTFANMVRGVDGQWSTVGAGGRDLHRHAHAADAYLKARLRQATQQRWGVQWERDPRTGAWEITEIGPALREQFSKRASQVGETLERLGLAPEQASTAQAKDAAARSREAKHDPGPGGDLRAAWHAQARAVTRPVEPAAVVAAATPGPGRTPPAPPSAQEIAAWIWRDGQDLTGGRVRKGHQEEHGLTAHTKVVSRADVLAAVMDAVPGGLRDLAEAERFTDAVLAVPGYAVRLPDTGAAHTTNHERYTSTDILDAERAILAAARERYAGDIAVVQPVVAALARETFEAAHGFELGTEQRAVLDRLLHAGHGVDAVIGVAGSGKTTIMSVLRIAYEAQGATVAGAATAAVAAANLQAEAGIGSATVASWLARIERGRGLSGVDVLVVDEAATVDDRQMARLLAHAGETGTKIIGIGDPMQLRAPGVGGAFAAVHELVDGLTLTDNRRQRDEAERAALALWRDGQRLAALTTWADSGRVHAVAEAADAHAAMLARWDQVRRAWPDPHERISQLLLLAGTNDDVERLNAGAQAIRHAAGELPGPARVYARPGGARLALHIGDQVLLRINDRRDDGPDVLNGYRGVVTGIGARGEVTVAWRRPGTDGDELVEQTVTADYVADGGVTLGYAMTVAKAQGLTAEQALVYGAGLDPNTLYPAMSRDRAEVHLWLPRALLEDDADRARLGEPATPAEELRRAVNAYAAALERAGGDHLVLAELEQLDLRPPQPAPPHPRAPLDQTIEGLHADLERISASLARIEAQRAARAWRTRPHGRLTDAQLARAISDAQRREVAAAQRTQAQARRVDADRARALAGEGPASQALRERREHLAAAAAAQARAEQAEQAARAARQAIRGLQAELQHNRIQLAMRGTSREELRAQVAEQTARAVHADQAAGAARGEAQHHQRALHLPHNVDARAVHAGLEQTWREHAQAAVDQDVAAAQAPQRSPVGLVRQAFAQQGGTVEQLRAEQDLRQQMSSEAAAAERVDRDQALAAARAQQHEQAEAHRQAEAYRQAEPEHGPELGL